MYTSKIQLVMVVMYTSKIQLVMVVYVHQQDTVSGGGVYTPASYS